MSKAHQAVANCIAQAIIAIAIEVDERGNGSARLCVCEADSEVHLEPLIYLRTVSPKKLRQDIRAVVPAGETYP
jgi:hypothetical protein